MISAIRSRLVRLATLSAAITSFSTGALSHAGSDLSDADLVFGEWVSVEIEGVPFAGVRANTAGYRALAISPVCDDERDINYSVAIPVTLGRFYSVFVTRQLMPGLAAGLIATDLRVDGEQSIVLTDLSADWTDGLLTVRGALPGAEHIESMEKGTDILANVRFDGATLITQRFSLTGSAAAISQLHCQ